MPNSRRHKLADHNQRIALVLQGGGALGAYQAGAYEELAAADLRLDWIAGISIGAINGAIIAGNPAEKRVANLNEFWETISSQYVAPPLIPGTLGRKIYNEASATLAVAFGVRGLFQPRIPPHFQFSNGTPEAVSLYDSEPLKKTLLRLVDFDLLNAGDIRFSVGAVNIRSGNFVYFDSRECEIGPDHIMASAALPPGLPPIEIDGELYWDGGLVSNTPLQHVLESEPREDMLVFQIDLFSAYGPAPSSVSDALEREKDIRNSSRTRHNTDMFMQHQTLRRLVRRALDRLPDDVKSDEEFAQLQALSCDAAVTIVHLVHRRKNYETQSKGHEFSRISVIEHWQAGRDDVIETLNHEAWTKWRPPAAGVEAFDLTFDERD